MDANEWSGQKSSFSRVRNYLLSFDKEIKDDHAWDSRSIVLTEIKSI